MMKVLSQLMITTPAFMALILKARKRVLLKELLKELGTVTIVRGLNL